MMDKRVASIVALTVVCAIAVVLVPPFPQPLRYHQLVDQRVLLGIANFGDVVSNIAFLIAGIAGFVVVLTRPGAFQFPVERWPYAVFFAGFVLTAFGSAYYHSTPDNARLFWDRLPMTFAFAGLVASQISDRISVRAGVTLLAPLLIAAASSVLYWRASGNLVPYVIVSGYTIVALVLVAVLWRSRYTHAGDMLWVFGWYALAKICEVLDRQIFDMGNVVSGHTLKHLFAAMVGFTVCSMLARRARLSKDARVVLKSRAAVT